MLKLVTRVIVMVFTHRLVFQNVTVFVVPIMLFPWAVRRLNSTSGTTREFRGEPRWPVMTLFLLTGPRVPLSDRPSRRIGLTRALSGIMVLRTTFLRKVFPTVTLEVAMGLCQRL